ncbi:L,D-transpeptidase family protein [Hydrogenophaga sp.]|uniref:L,D-transpeptidase family protein n=1 Tax=Hydrogenophaga sp. TaxID=1904254 RepID=UPI003AF78A81
MGQRGHASVAAGLQGQGMSRRAAWALGAVLVTALIAVGIHSARQDSHLPRSASESLDTTEPSLLNQALARVQDAARSPLPASPSGLQTNSLTPARFDEVKPMLGQAEARLISIYQLISQGQHREALALADKLVTDHPNFQLAHLVHGDLLSLQARPVRQLGDVPDTKALAASQQLSTLREESRRRLLALTERPPEGSIPTQFLTLAPQSRHAIAIDASRSRLYLFENLNPAKSSPTDDRQPKLKLVGDFYISVGLSGIEKSIEGDKRTPLGVYYITSTLNPADLPDLYGVGALPINYPNPLDVQRGKTGSGIWLHGTPSDQFVRAPLASDGCVVLSNPDLERLLRTVQIRTTPVVIAPELQWVQPDTLSNDREQFESVLEAWRRSRSEGNLAELKGFYSSRFSNQGRDLAQWWPRVEGELRSTGPRELAIKDLSVLRWNDTDDTLVVTFGEVAAGQTRGVTKRQYWIRENDRWTIFFEGTIG